MITALWNWYASFCLPNKKITMRKVWVYITFMPIMFIVSIIQKVILISFSSFNHSVAILKYLADKFKCSDHWYPKQLQMRAKVDEYLAWQHLNTRYNCGKLFVREVITTFSCLFKSQCCHIEVFSRQIQLSRSLVSKRP